MSSIPKIITSLLGLAASINAQPGQYPRYTCTNASVSATWVLNPPLSWDAEEYREEVDFWLYNTGAQAIAHCRSEYQEGGYYLSGPCKAPTPGHGWEKPYTIGNFAFDTADPYNHTKPRVLNITQTWTCGGPGQSADSYTGTVAVNTARQDKGWLCNSMGRDGELWCDYTLPMILSPRVNKL